MADESLPSGYHDLSPAARRVYDVLDEADSTLSKSTLVEETHHAERTIDSALSELRGENLVVGWGWPRRYRLNPSESSH